MSVLDSTISMLDIKPRKNGPVLVHRPEQRESVLPSRSTKTLHRAAKAEPARQQRRVQAPAEYPGDCAQILDAVDALRPEGRLRC